MRIIKKGKKYKLILQEEISFEAKTPKDAEKLAMWWLHYTTFKVIPGNYDLV